MGLLPIAPYNTTFFFFVSRSVGRATVQIRHFILRSPGVIGALRLDSKLGCIINDFIPLCYALNCFTLQHPSTQSNHLAKTKLSSIILFFLLCLFLYK